MTQSSLMSRTELTELAALDAFGLLDEYEAALFTRSFHHATPAVQDEIRELQARLVSDASLLPQEEPPAELKQQVLDVVAEAVDREATELAPLATIGAHAQRAQIAGRVNWSGAGQYWRAAAFVLCAGIIAIAYFLAETQQQANLISRMALLNNTDAQLEQHIGPTVKDFLFDSQTQTIHFRTTDDSSKVRATLLVKEGTNQGFLIIEGLPQTDQFAYSLIAKDAEGNTEVVATFPSNGRISGTQIALNSSQAITRTVTWEIAGPSGTLLTTV